MMAKCEAHNIPYRVTEITLPSRLHARIWIRTNQLARRNLCDAERCELAVGNKDDLAEIGRAKQSDAGGDKKSEAAKEKIAFVNIDKSDFAEPKHDTRAELAKQAGSFSFCEQEIPLDNRKNAVYT